MQKNILYLTFLLFLSGCGSDFTPVEDSTSQTSSTQVANGTEACVQEHYQKAVVSKMGSCTGCHRSGGAADPEGLALNFPDPGNPSDLSNYQALKSYIEQNGTTIIDKINGGLAHSGGSSFSAIEPALNTLVSYVQDVPSCTVEARVNVKPIARSSMTLLDPKEIAGNAAKILLSRTATDAELASVTDQQSLETLLDTYMNEDAFYDFIRLKFNDLLLVRKYDASSQAISLISTNEFPNRDWWNTNDANETTFRTFTNDGVYKAPLELIVHILKQNRPFSEILTADYMMVNPFSAKSYGIDITGFTYQMGDPIIDSNASEFREAKITGAVSGPIPQAGVLSDVVFLNRFPNTNTNRNRHRTYETMLLFLGVDILGLADRPVTANEQALAYEYPTTQNPNCTVCHFVMDPIAGTFKNFDNRGRYQANRSWNLNESGPIGYTLDDLMDSATQQSGSLQWLAQKIVNDPRFDKQSVALFYQALSGRMLLSKPAIGADDYYNKAQAFMFQDSVMRQIGTKFKGANMNAKMLIKELFLSPLLSVKQLSEGATNKVLSESLGLGALITPEALDEKIKKSIGYYWTNRFDTSNSGGNDSGTHYLLSNNDYLSMYGGIDSDQVTKRPDSINGIMANVQMRMAIEMGCFSAARDFFFPQSSRKLFPFVNSDIEPTTTANVIKIRQNIQYLHKHLLGEIVDVNSKEVQATFALFNKVYQEGKNAIAVGDESANLSSLCDVTRHPDTAVALGSESTPRLDGQRIQKDSNYMIRSWSAVLTYLLSDFKFVYNTSAL